MAKNVKIEIDISTGTLGVVDGALFLGEKSPIEIVGYTPADGHILRLTLFANDGVTPLADNHTNSGVLDLSYQKLRDAFGGVKIPAVTPGQFSYKEEQRCTVQFAASIIELTTGGAVVNVLAKGFIPVAWSPYVIDAVSGAPATLKGDPGRDGVDGRDGEDGADGQDGADGRDGRDGERGLQGIPGIQGDRGADAELDTAMPSTQPSEDGKGLTKRGIWNWVKSLLPSWLTPSREEPPTQASVNAAIIANVENSTTSTSATKALSANMGKELQAQIQNLKQRGRYLSVWNCSTGLAETIPTVNPYEYKAGDYFIVGTVATEGGTNYRPSGTQYDKDVPSTTIETGTPIVNDTYYYDGTTWTLLHTEQAAVTWGSIADKPTEFPPEAHTHTNDNWFTTAIDAVKSWVSGLLAGKRGANNYTVGWTFSGSEVESGYEYRVRYIDAERVWALDARDMTTEQWSERIAIVNGSADDTVLSFADTYDITATAVVAMDALAGKLDSKQSEGHELKWANGFLELYTGSEQRTTSLWATGDIVSGAGTHSLNRKADRPSSYTSGNLASLTADGNLADSGITKEEVKGKLDGPTDTTLTLTGKAADAKATGDALRYALYSVPTSGANANKLKDRAVNAFTYSGGNLPTFPAQVAGYARDFLLNVTATADSSNITIPEPDGSTATSIGDALAFTAGKTYLVAITEIAAKYYYIRVIDTTPSNAA